ncbi:MAG: enoyl-CoA hydratase/isomerase family protein [Frankiaceae bacterium]|nr:enoyl-CoA hydratase/isomerase family protein [Frankiaceae bacterium]MBV9369312.1 enoyl-CoA hydratase/isomerase family protein [Frankiales bacterium]
MSDTIRYDVSGAGVATITLNRPDALNALTVEMKLALLDALGQAASDDVRAVVLTGEGRAFCVGQDLREHADSLASGDVELDTVRSHYNPIARAVAGLAKPVIAAVNGTAAGAGASLAFACDLRLAADTASFLMAFARVGLGPDTGASWTLPRLIGHGRAAAMLMLAEPVAAPQALEMGLVNAVIPSADLAAAAAELAARLAAGPTQAYAAIKRTLAVGAVSDLDSALEAEAAAQAALGHTADHQNATAAFLAKQPVTFTGR